MKSLLILFCVVVLIHSVHSSCYSCKPGGSSCADPYFPPGSIYQACSGFHPDLCRKYGGSYEIYCVSFTTTVSCAVTCGAGPIAPSLLLISAVIAFAFKLVH